MTKPVFLTSDAQPRRRGLPRWVGIVAIALSSLAALYVTMFFALFFWFGERVAVAPTAHVYLYDRRNGSFATVMKITAIREPAWAHDFRWNAGVSAIYYPLVYSTYWSDAVPVPPAQRDQVTKRLEDFHIHEGQGLLWSFSDGKVHLSRRTGLWSSAPRETLPDPDYVKPSGGVTE